MATEFYINQDTDFNTSIDLLNNDGTAINIAGYQFIGVVRKSYYSNAVANLIITVNGANANGNVSISMPANVSSNIEAGNYLYSINMTDTSNTVTPILSGRFTILPSAIINQSNNYPKFFPANVAPYLTPVVPFS